MPRYKKMLHQGGEMMELPERGSGFQKTGRDQIEVQRFGGNRQDDVCHAQADHVA